MQFPLHHGRARSTFELLNEKGGKTRQSRDTPLEPQAGSTPIDSHDDFGVESAQCNTPNLVPRVSPGEGAGECC